MRSDHPQRARLDEAPGLAGREQDLYGLRIDDVAVRPVSIEGEVVGWLAVVLLATSRTVQPVPWVLGLRPSEEEAQAAVTALLKGLLKGQKRARRDHPAIADPPDEPAAAMVDVVNQVAAEWFARRWPRTKTQMGPAEPANGLMAEMTQERRDWGLKVRETRTAWGWTQKALAEKAGIDAPRLSKIERGKLVPPGDLQERLCEILDLDPPKSLAELRADG